MLRFFRNIRQKLIEKDEIRKYLVYAVGEILLVVIGILIALQVNNWNEENKLEQQINGVLTEINNDLIQNKVELEENALVLQEDVKAQERVIETLENNGLFTDKTYADLGRVMLLRRVTLTNNGYDILQDLGISNLKDKNLRSEIIDYYETHVAEVLSEIEDDKVEFEDSWIEYVRVNFEYWEFGKRAVPNNDSEIRSASYFLTMLRMNLSNRRSTLQAHIEALEANNALSGSIKTKSEGI